jgi:predicted DsbA family dithiol-disulfide isomerase
MLANIWAAEPRPSVPLALAVPAPAHYVTRVTAESRAPQPLTIDVWSDIACPWCWVGKRNLEAALADLDHPVAIRWHAFELDPRAPRSVGENHDYVGRLARKYGATREQAQAMIDRMVGAGASAGVDFRFDRIRPGNTFDAHRLLHWAAEHERQTALKERLLAAYMNEGRSIADPAELAQLAADVGLDAEAAAAVLASDDFAAEVRADEDTAARLGVSGVPFFVVGQRYAVPGAQPPSVLLQILRKRLAELEPEPPDLPEGAVCTPESC